MVFVWRYKFIKMILNTHGIINSSIWDADALTFISNAVITSATEKNAINYLVKALKANNLWTKLYAIYPFVGGTSSTCKWNLKDPRDLDAAYRLTFSGGLTFDSIGMLGNATNGYANTYFNPSWPNYPFFSIGIYLALNLDEAGATGAHMGTINSSNKGYSISARNSNVYYAQAWDAIVSTTVANTDSKGFYIVTRTSSTNAKTFKNGSIFVNHANQSGNYGATYDILIGCRNNSGTPLYFNSNKTGFAFIGNGLTDTESINLNSIFSTFKTITSK